MKISQESFDSYANELKELEEKTLPMIQKKYQEAIDTGDGYHDNFLIQEATEQIERVKKKKLELEKILRNATILEQKRVNSSVQLGSTVTVKNDAGVSYTFTIVEEIEANPAERKISLLSAWGRALEGKKQEDLVVVNGKRFRIGEIK